MEMTALQTYLQNNCVLQSIDEVLILQWFKFREVDNLIYDTDDSEDEETLIEFD